MFDNLPLVANLAILAVSAAIVWFAGSRLARYADAIATKTGIGQAAIGVLLLGSITSLPELAVAVTATFSGHPALSVNDVLGSAAINVLLLALADAALGRGALTVTPATPGVMLQGSLSLLLLLLVAAAVVAGDRLVLGMGISSWLMLITYGFALRIIVSAKGHKSWTPARRSRAASAAAQEGPASKLSLSALIVRTAVVAAAILFAGFLLAQTGAAIAKQSGFGTNFVGAVLVGAVTSLPEVSTVLAAVRMKRYEMAISDVFGTNLFNILIIVVVDLLHPGKPILVEVGAFAGFAALLAGLLTVLFLVGMLERRDKTFMRMGLDSLAAILCYAGGLVVLYQLR